MLVGTAKAVLRVSPCLQVVSPLGPLTVIPRRILKSWSLQHFLVFCKCGSLWLQAAKLACLHGRGHSEEPALLRSPPGLAQTELSLPPFLVGPPHEVLVSSVLAVSSPD